MATAFEALAHRLGHLPLLGPVFESLHHARGGGEACVEVGGSDGDRRLGALEGGIFGGGAERRQMAARGDRLPAGARDGRGEARLVHPNEPGELAALFGREARGPLEQAGEDGRGGLGVVQGAMVPGDLDAQVSRNLGQPVRAKPRRQVARKFGGIEGLDAQAHSFAGEVVQVEPDVMSDDDGAIDKRLEVPGDCIDARLARDHLVGDPGEAFDERGNRTARVDEPLERFELSPVGLKANSADLDDAVGFRVQPGCLQIERDVGGIHLANIRANEQSTCRASRGPVGGCIFTAGSVRH